MKLTREGLLTAVLVVAALFIGSFVGQLFPTTDDIHNRPFLHEARLGEPVRLRTGTVTATSYVLPEELSSGGSVAVTTGAWLVVQLTWLAHDEPTPLALDNLRLRAPDGRTFGGQPGLTSTCGPGQPGIELACQVAFEVTPDAIVGSTLLVPAVRHLDGPDDVAVIDLGIGEAVGSMATEADGRTELGPPVESVR